MEKVPDILLRAQTTIKLLFLFFDILQSHIQLKHHYQINIKGEKTGETESEPSSCPSLRTTTFSEHDTALIRNTPIVNSIILSVHHVCFICQLIIFRVEGEKYDTLFRQ